LEASPRHSSRCGLWTPYQKDHTDTIDGFARRTPPAGFITGCCKHIPESPQFQRLEHTKPATEPWTNSSERTILSRAQGLGLLPRQSSLEVIATLLNEELEDTTTADISSWAGAAPRPSHTVHDRLCGKINQASHSRCRLPPTDQSWHTSNASSRRDRFQSLVLGVESKNPRSRSTIPLPALQNTPSPRCSLQNFTSAGLMRRGAWCSHTRGCLERLGIGAKLLEETAHILHGAASSSTLRPSGPTMLIKGLLWQDEMTRIAMVCCLGFKTSLSWSSCAARTYAISVSHYWHRLTRTRCRLPRADPSCQSSKVSNIRSRGQSREPDGEPLKITPSPQESKDLPRCQDNRL